MKLIHFDSFEIGKLYTLYNPNDTLTAVFLRENKIRKIYSFDNLTIVCKPIDIFLVLDIELSAHDTKQNTIKFFVDDKIGYADSIRTNVSNISAWRLINK